VNAGRGTPTASTRKGKVETATQSPILTINRGGGSRGFHRRSPQRLQLQTGRPASTFPRLTVWYRARSYGSVVSHVSTLQLRTSSISFRRPLSPLRPQDRRKPERVLRVWQEVETLLRPQLTREPH